MHISYLVCTVSCAVISETELNVRLAISCQIDLNIPNVPPTLNQRPQEVATKCVATNGGRRIFLLDHLILHLSSYRELRDVGICLLVEWLRPGQFNLCQETVSGCVRVEFIEVKLSARWCCQELIRLM